MIIKKFIANTEDEALAAARRELGPDVVIVSRRTLRPVGIKALFASSKVEVTAASDDQQRTAPVYEVAAQRAEPVSENQLADNLSRLKQAFAEDPVFNRPEQGEDHLALSPAAREHLLGQRQQSAAYTPRGRATPKSEPVPAPNCGSDMKRATEGLLARFGGEEQEKPKPVTLASTPSPSGESDLRRLIREEVEKAQASVSVGALENNQEDTVGSVRFLMAKGVARSTALEIEAELDKRLGKSIPGAVDRMRISEMKKELAQRVRTAGPIRLTRGQSTAVALVGPHGVGKTTTLIKLAVKYGHELGKRVAVISLDNAKVGAREQIRGLTDQFRIPLTLAATPFELKQALLSYGDRDLVLIDTSGRSQYDRRQVDDLAELLSVVENLHTYVTVSATTKDIDVYGTIQQFAPIPLDGVIVTKLDETIAYGLMINVCCQTPQPLAYLASGPRIPEDLRVADPEDIARCLMVHHNNQEFQGLRAMVS